MDQKMLPQLMAYGNPRAQAIIRNLPKVKVEEPDQLLDLGVTTYESTTRLDGQAFRYVVMNGKFYLRELVSSLGGLVQDSVLVDLGEFTPGEATIPDEDWDYLVQLKDAKTKQRRHQLQEAERLARVACRQITKQADAAVVQAWQARVAENYRFVRPGLGDFYQSQMLLADDFAAQDENLAKIVVDYQAKLNKKAAKLPEIPRLQPVKDVTLRQSQNDWNFDLGVVQPLRRVDFMDYYHERAPQLDAYLYGEVEIIPEPTPEATQTAENTNPREATNTPEAVTQIVYEKGQETPAELAAASAETQRANLGRLRQAFSGSTKTKNTVSKENVTTTETAR